MAKVVPPAPRARITENGDALRVVIPPWRNWFLFAMLCPLLLLVWPIGEIIGLAAVWMSNFTGSVMLCFWTVAGAIQLFHVLWFLFGREEIVAEGTVLYLRYTLFGVGKTQTFDRRARHTMRVTPDAFLLPFEWASAWTHGESRMSMWNLTGIGCGPFTFHYGAKTYRFGAGTDEAEARHVLPHLLRRLSPGDPTQTETHNKER